MQQRAVFTRRDGGHHKHLSHYCAVVVVVTFACEIRMQNSAVSAPPSSSMKMKMMMMMMPENEKEENGNVNYCILASSSSRYNPFAVFFYSCIFLPRGMGWDEHKSCTGKLVLWKWKRFCYIYSLLVSSWNMANYYDVMIVTMEGPL